MPLSPRGALDAVRAVLNDQRVAEQDRLERIHRALQPTPERGSWSGVALTIPESAPKLMRDLARKSETNYLPLVVKTFAQVMKVDGCTFASDPGGRDPWVTWQRNRMDSRQAGLTRAALAYGAAYATALPGVDVRGVTGPAVSLFSPRQMTAVYQDPEADEWPMLAVNVDRDGRGRGYVTLFDEEAAYLFGVEGMPVTGPAPTLSAQWGGGLLTFIETRRHDLGMTPVVRFRDRNLLSGEEQYGIVEPLITVQERLDEQTYQGSVTLFLQAFKQRYVLGWVPESEAEDLKTGAGTIWYVDKSPSEVTISELPSGDAKAYIEARNATLRDMAALGQIPVQTLGIDGISNISDATLAGLEAAKNRESGEITTSLGESYEQLLRLTAHIDGNVAAADDYAAEVRWRNFEARSFAQVVDGLGKLSQMLGVPAEDLIEDIPGMTGQRIDRIKSDMRRAAARVTLTQLAAAAGRSGGVQS